MYDSEGGGGGTSWFRTNAAFSNSAGEINENQINPDPASPTERLKVRLRLHIWLTSSIWMKREHSQTTTTPPSCCSKCGFPQCSTGQWVCMFVRLFCELLGAQIRTMQQWRMEFNFLFFFAGNWAAHGPVVRAGLTIRSYVRPGFHTETFSCN